VDLFGGSKGKGLGGGLWRAPVGNWRSDRRGSTKRIRGSLKRLRGGGMAARRKTRAKDKDWGPGKKEKKTRGARP